MIIQPEHVWSARIDGARCERIACAPDGLIWLSTARDDPATEHTGASIIDGSRHTLQTGAGVKLVALDDAGVVRHSLDGLALVTTLPDGAILAASASELLPIDDPAHSPMRREPLDDKATVIVCGDRVGVKSGDRVAVLSQKLERLAGFELCGWSFYQAADDGIYWADENRIQLCDWAGQRTEIAGIPLEQVYAEIRRVIPDFELMFDSDDRLISSHPALMNWHVSPDADDQLLFACNRMPGFTVVCYSRRGELRWMRCLSRGCCGDRVQRLRCGVFVASSGCGGTVSWLDSAGNVLAQSAPLFAAGIGHLLSPDLLIDVDDSVYASRLDGTVLAFDSSGRPRWEMRGKGSLPKIELDRWRRRLLCSQTAREPSGDWRITIDAWVRDA